MATTNTQGNKLIKGKGDSAPQFLGCKVIGPVVLRPVVEQYTMLKTRDRVKHTHPISPARE